MKVSSFHPTAFFLLLAVASVLNLTLAAAPEESKASLQIQAIVPASPAKLAAGEKLMITIDYRNPDARPMHIWARPFTKGKSTPGYRAHPSPSYEKVSGSAEGWFYFDRPTEVDEVRVEMKSSGSNELIASVSLPIKVEWTGEKSVAGAKVPDSGTASSRSASGGAPVSAASSSKAGVAVGTPIDIKFTAVDGREVDFAKLRGKVVLIDFWATWCGPCIGELPHVLEAYRKFHDKGFEIVGISFDQDKGALERMTKDKGMTWPQYFDGKGWKNAYGVQYGIHGIPTMWLVDREGRIATTNARQNLAGQIEKLLEGSKQP